MTEFIWKEKKQNEVLRRMIAENPFFKQKKKSRKYEINNLLPVMVSEQGEIVCIERKHDTHDIAIVGARRTGKSLMAWGMLDRIYRDWSEFGEKIKIAVLNDFHSESHSHSYYNNADIMAKQTDYFREIRMGLPLVHCYPTTNTLSIPKDIPHAKKVSLPFTAFIENPSKFADLGKSKPYFYKIKDQLMSCETEAEAKQLLDELIENTNTKNKILSVFDMLFNENIFDITSNSPSTFTVDNKELNPFVALMEAGLIPSLLTSHVYAKDYYSDIVGYYAEQIFDAQDVNNIWGKKNYEVYAFCDELNTVQKKNEDILVRYVAEGANRRVALIWATQNYSLISQRIRDNTKYVFSFRQKSKETAALKADFDLSESEANSLKNLNKMKFECVGMTQENFKLYDPYNNIVTDSCDPVKGTLLFPLSRPKAPRLMDDDL